MFEIGDVVQIKGAEAFVDPKMTVIAISNEDGVECCWFDHQREFRRAWIPAVALNPVDDE